jgi:hypothetical protein
MEDQCLISENGTYCAHRGTMKSDSVFYAVMPDQVGCGFCDSGNALRDILTTASWQLAAAVTNPDLNTGWLDTQGVGIATKCLSNVGKTVGSDGETYDVQFLWSNKEGKCVDSAPQYSVAKSSGSSKKAGIVAAVLIILFAAILTVLFLWWRRRYVWRIIHLPPFDVSPWAQFSFYIICRRHQATVHPTTKPEVEKDYRMSTIMSRLSSRFTTAIDELLVWWRRRCDIEHCYWVVIYYR